MATHRRVKNIDYDEDEDDFENYLEPDYDEQLGEPVTDQNSDEYREKTQKGIIEVQKVLGSGCKVTTTEIGDTLWYYYFDVPKSIAYLQEKYAIQAPKPNKPLTKFERAAALAGRKVDKKPSAEQLEAFERGLVRPCGRESPFTSAGLFEDIPWLNVPAYRLAIIHCEPRHPRYGLLGGSASSSSKPSKLAQLAAARKKAAAEKQRSEAIAVKVVGPKSNEPAVKPLPEEGSGKPHANALSISISQYESPSENLKMSELSSHTKAKTLYTEGPLHTKTDYPRVNNSSSTQPTSEHQIETSIDFKANPSTFAKTVFGNFNSSNPSFTFMSSHFSSMPKSIHGQISNFNAFTVPSPDDKVLKAQSKGTKGDKSTTNTPTDITTEIATLKVEEPSSRTKSKNLDVVAEFEKSNAKIAANFVVIGHVDHGKSTLMGRLLYDLGVVDQRSIGKLRKEADAMKKSSFALAWVMDSTSEERQRGVTVDIATNHFETERTRFTILDAPGHQDFIPNMIAGASQADFAVLVIDASTNAFESGLRGQTKEHVLLARSLGIGRLIVAINKMDTVSWSEERFNTIKEQMSAFFSKQGFVAKNISFIPCAGLTGENVAKPPEDGKMPWYTNGTLVDELDRSEPTKRAITNPLRMIISNIFRDSIQNPLSVSGRIDAGSLQLGDTVLAMPANERAVIKGIDVDNNPQDWAVAGQIAVLHLTDIDPVHLRLGDVICSPHQRPIRNINSFTVKILAFDHVTPTYVDVYRGRMQAPARITALVAVLDKQSGSVTKKKPRIIQPGEVARVRVDLEGTVLPLEAPSRVVFRTGGKTIAAGLIESVQ